MSCGVTAARTFLRELCRDHLLQQSIPGRYTLHDLVRAYATGRAVDEDSPPERRAALTRLFDYYLAAAATAMDTLYPAEAHRRPRIPAPGTPSPDLTDSSTARVWLGTERPILVAVAAYTATCAWPTHTTRLSTTLSPYLAGHYLAGALAVHGHALRAACHAGDPTGQAHALTRLGFAQALLSRTGRPPSIYGRPCTCSGRPATRPTRPAPWPAWAPSRSGWATTSRPPSTSRRP